ncbi:MAG: dockerin type I repeat-containing protein, partial [Clostridia bacterium]|nr:dockerin type I repeat-containing protein [Clostridia bacterium]
SFGDVNEDGRVSIKDVIYLSQHLENIRNLSPQALKNADVNNDGLVNSVDIVLLRQYLVANYESLPITDYVIYGDVNEDGRVSIKDVISLLQYLENIRNLSPQALKNADVNNDGSVDYVDIVLLRQYLVSTYKSLPITDYVIYNDSGENMFFSLF